MIALLGCSINIVSVFGARYYRLNEMERKIFLGFRGIDSVAAAEYINLKSSTERGYFYENYWEGKDEEKRQFDERIEYAFREFGRYAPLSDDRILIYVKYGLPSKRTIYTPQKIITSKEVVKPAEVWTYKREGIEFDFVREARAFKKIAQTEFGDRVKIPYLKEDTLTLPANLDLVEILNFDVAYGRFRQKKNLTRLELYVNLEIDDTTNFLILRKAEIFDQQEGLISEKKNVLRPIDGAKGIFYDEINFWVEPKQYRIAIQLLDLKNKRAGKKEFLVDLLEYAQDVKEISDLVAAKLIDNSFTAEKFNKIVGRMIPLTKNIMAVRTPFYFYHEVYNLTTRDGLYQLRTTYEIYNKAKMKKEIVDVLTQDKSEEGDVAYLPTKYHPMDLAPGQYIIVARSTDLLTGKERTAVSEFQLIEK